LPQRKRAASPNKLIMMREDLRICKSENQHWWSVSDTAVMGHYWRHPPVIKSGKSGKRVLESNGTLV
jgi:hypothetical protein